MSGESVLLSIPPEVIEKIAEWLGASDKKTLRTVCQQLNEIIERLIFSKLVLKYSNYQPDLLCDQLEALATRTTNARLHAQTLEIRGLGPDSVGARSRSRSVERSRSRSRGPLADTHFVNKAMIAHLGTAISSLRKLKIVVLHFSPSDPEWTRIVIMDSLATLPYLEELQVFLGGGSASTLRLEQLTNLRKIMVTGITDDYRFEVVPGLRTLISNSSSLSHLHVDNSSYRAEYDTSTLHDLLDGECPNISLNLTHLNLRGLCILLDARTIPHLRSLESLNLCNVVDTRHDDLSHLDNLAAREELVERTVNFCSSLNDIWDALREEGVFLKDIVVDKVTDALVNYLDAYSGLRSLTLAGATSASNKLAGRFYNDVLPRHVQTLVFLEIIPQDEGKWCFGKHNMETFLQCARLSTLKVAIQLSEIDREKDFDVVWTLLKVADNLPYLEHLSICSTDSENNPSIGYTYGVNKEIVKSVSSFGPIDPTSHSKIVSTPVRDFRARSDEDAGPGLWYRSSMSQGSRLDK